MFSSIPSGWEKPDPIEWGFFSRNISIELKWWPLQQHWCVIADQGGGGENREENIEGDWNQKLWYQIDVKREDRNHFQTKNWRNRVFKEEIEKRLGFREKNRINIGLRTFCAGFTPLTPRALHPNTQEHPQENLTGKFLIIHCPSYSLSWASYISSYKVNFPITTDVGLNFNKRNK